jgi:tetratricopeptide (TPR) repeat protein
VLLADNLSEITLSGSRSAAAIEEPTSVEILRVQFRDNFQAGEFATAVTLGEQLIALPAVTDTDRLNLGFAYLRASQFSEAEKTFRGLLAVNSPFASEARYYLGQTLLAAGDTEAGLDELRKISAADGGRLLESAKELLDANWE